MSVGPDGVGEGVAAGLPPPEEQPVRATPRASSAAAIRTVFLGTAVTISTRATPGSAARTASGSS